MRDAQPRRHGEASRRRLPERFCAGDIALVALGTHKPSRLLAAATAETPMPPPAPAPGPPLPPRPDPRPPTPAPNPSPVPPDPNPPII
jgi:hypothetical protein